MTNEIRTRHLIVTLPNTTGEDADAIAASIEHDTVADGIDVAQLAPSLADDVAAWAKAVEDLSAREEAGEHGPRDWELFDTTTYDIVHKLVAILDKIGA